MERSPGFFFGQVAHRGGEDLVGLVGPVDLDLEQGAALGSSVVSQSWEAFISRDGKGRRLIVPIVKYT